MSKKVIVKGTTAKEQVLSKIAYDDGYYYGFRVGTEATIEDLISLHNGTLCGVEAPAGLFEAYEDIRGTAYSKGHDEGYDDGYDKGLDALEKANLEDVDASYNSGVIDGSEKGKKIGYKRGYNEGYEEGFKNGNAYPEEVINERAEAIARKRYDEIRAEAYEDGKNDLVSTILNHLGIEAIEVLDTQSLIYLLEERMTKVYADGWDSALLEVRDALADGIECMLTKNN